MWKTFLVTSCLCAIAFAQRRPTADPFVTTPEPDDSVIHNYNLQGVPSNSQSKYPCKEKNERYPMPGSCDQYVECVNGTAEEKVCPDGLRFNPNLSYKSYPCVYPNEYRCLERSSLQPSQPTDQCPNQFGYFRLGDSRNCSWFRNCVNGVGYDITCPEGLAFDSETYRCQWADEVSDCDVEAFIGFSCPELKVVDEFGPPAAYRFYKSKIDCQKYYLCIGTKPRILRCGGASAFSEASSTCISADEVETCPEELKVSAARSKALEKLISEKELEFSANPPLIKRRLIDAEDTTSASNY